MSRFLADHLTAALLTRLSADTALDRAGVAIIMCTVDEHGWPHPAMLSSLEVVARDAHNVRLATNVASRSTRNLKVNGKLSLILADEHSVHYLKGDVILLEPSMQSAPHNAKFNMRVDSVLEDLPTEWEHARLLSGIRIERPNLDTATARATLAELLTP